MEALASFKLGKSVVAQLIRERCVLFRGNVHSLLPLPEESGWNKSNDGYTFDWEAPETQSRVQVTIDFLMKGCSCKKGVEMVIMVVGRKEGTVDQLVYAKT